MTRKLFFTSDTHFGHEGILKHQSRKFASAPEMDGEIIKRWNSVVRPSDTIFHLGDLSFKGVEYTAHILEQLNGFKVWIPGNHDKGMTRKKELEKHFIEIDKLKEIVEDGQHIVMCHFPMLTWNKSHYGSWMLHGHSHGTCKYPDPLMKIMDVGVDTNDMYPWSFEEIRKKMDTIPKTVSFDQHNWKGV